MAQVLGVRSGALKVGPPGDPTGEVFGWWVGVLRSGSRVVWNCRHQHSNANEAAGCSRELVVVLRLAASRSLLARVIAGTLRAWDAWNGDVPPDGIEFDRLERAVNRLAEMRRALAEAGGLE
ncbi:MAG TPA: hypothetical protein VH208_02530 [Myxococcaceae bacterium]|jgi:hypothetical protein|nr:hypothetical protein [Myxococcaceae bacterium]